MRQADGSIETDIATDIAIVGAGFGGLGAAIRLEQQGLDDFVVLERADDVGGTWRDNAYPGCACDVESLLYSFSFAPNPEWRWRYARQPEIQVYLRHCAERFGILPHLRFGHELRAAEWDDAARRWRVRTARGTVTARVLVLAPGFLSDPSIPCLPGLDRFEGVAFHSGRWNHACDLAGRHVVVIGTGASAAQFVPAIQPRAARLTLFQRTPPWVLPRPDWRIGAVHRALLRRLPPLGRLERASIYLGRELLVPLFRHPHLMRQAQRLALRHLARQVPDPALRDKLTPRYVMGCKRIVLSNDYLASLAQPNVEVVTTGVAEVRAGSVVDGAGIEHPADVIVFGTGFHVTDPPWAPHVRGRGGRTLADAWDASPSAHLGTTVAGFPNLFVLLGPNTGLGHTSVVFMEEVQIAHLLDALRLMRARGADTIEPRPEAQARWEAEVARRMRGTVWVDGGCASWYLDPTGRNSTLWPDFTWRYRRRAAHARAADYRLAGESRA